MCIRDRQYTENQGLHREFVRKVRRVYRRVQRLSLIHILYGGVVPEIASRQHLESINGVVEQALKNAGCTMEEIDVLGVTQGPGPVSYTHLQKNIK